jgi:hypothetical protein
MNQEAVDWVKTLFPIAFVEENGRRRSYKTLHHGEVDQWSVRINLVNYTTNLWKYVIRYKGYHMDAGYEKGWQYTRVRALDSLYELMTIQQTKEEDLI